MKLKRNITLKILIFAQIMFLFSCRTGKVPKNEYLFIGTKFKYLDKKGKPYLNEYGQPFLDEKGKPILNAYKKPFEDGLESYVKQKPNEKVLFIVPLSLWFFDFSNQKFDTIYAQYYQVDPKKRNQKLLDSLYIENNLQNYIGKSRWLDRFFYNNGNPPVLVDSMTSRSSALNLQQYYINRGWRKAIVNDTLLASRKKAEVQYNIKLGRPTIIDSVTYDWADEIRDDLYKGYVNRRGRLNPKKLSTQVKKEDFAKIFLGRNSLVKAGSRLDAYVLGDEITRIENLFRNAGYFGFNELKDEVIYYVDTAKSIYKVPVRLSIRKSPLFTLDSKDSLKTDTIIPKFKRFRYSRINLTLEDPKNKDGELYPIEEGYFVTDSKVRRLRAGKAFREIRKDTVAYIVNKTGGRYNNKVLVNLLSFTQGHRYRLNSEIETRRNIYKINNFNIQRFTTQPEEKSDSTLVTNIVLTPMQKYSYSISFESFRSSVANFAITPNLTFSARNLFRGAENLNISFGGSLGNIESAQNKSDLFNASEISTQASLSFPKLLLPFNTDKIIPKGWGGSSAISIGYNAQFNIGLDRRSYNTALSYNFTPTRTTIHQISPLSIQYNQFLKPENYFNVYQQDARIRDAVYQKYFQLYPDLAQQYQEGAISDDQVLSQIQGDNVFLNNLQNQNVELFNNYNLLESRRFVFTQNVLIASLKYDFTYDQRLAFIPNKHPFYLRARLELAGNTLSLFNSSLKKFETNTGQVVREIYNVPYSQFVKLDVDIRKYWNWSQKKSINARFFAGIGVPYGNSFSMPFDRSYSVGGPSDVRAWRVFGFGPGDSKLGTLEGFELTAIGNFKLLSSVEYRFPLPANSFEGALFVDAGNIWGTTADSPNKFHFNDFYKQLGIGGGWGVRWNISNFIIRFDFAYKFHDPTRDEGDRWYLKYINPLKPQLNFAIDYPF